MKIKYIFISLAIRNELHEFTSHTVHKIAKEKDLLEFADNYAKTFYVDENKPFKNEAGYHFYGGGVTVKLSLVEEIAKREYDVLGKFQHK
jgi:hypothetical protein